MLQLQIPELFNVSDVAAYCWVVGVIAAVTLVSFSKLSDCPNLDKIPSVGSNTWLGSWWSGIRFLIDATNVAQEGYEKYKGTPFKISTFYGWMVILSGRQHTEEFCKCRDDELSFIEAVKETMKADHTLGPDTLDNPYHIAVLRSKMSRNLEALYADISDEIVTAFDEILNDQGHDWKSIPALDTINQIVTRASNRLFVGLPLCRDPDWVRLILQSALDGFKGVAIMNVFPKFMEPFVARFIADVSGSTKRAVNRLAPIVEERRKCLDGYGSTWVDKPNDLLTWMMEGPEGSRRTVEDLTMRILAINFAAVHTSSNSFTQALYNLAANPQYIQVLRKEVESVVKDEGWSKAALAKMHKVDSFVKESQRMNVIGLMSVMRKAMKDVTFSDGTVIPKGTYVALATQAMHLDDEYYKNAAAFDPFRFANLRSARRQDGDGDGVRHHSATTSLEYLVFGHGIHACPGRFFAANMLNTMLARLVLSYDVKLEENATRPRNLRICGLVAAHPTARVMFRRRERERESIS